ncbi:MAG: hypothetical protein AAF851_22330 [Myxococcota bacterium]
MTSDMILERIEVPGDGFTRGQVLSLSEMGGTALCLEDGTGPEFQPCAPATPSQHFRLRTLADTDKVVQSAPYSFIVTAELDGEPSMIRYDALGSVVGIDALDRFNSLNAGTSADGFVGPTGTFMDGELLSRNYEGSIRTSFLTSDEVLLTEAVRFGFVPDLRELAVPHDTARETTVFGSFGIPPGPPTPIYDFGVSAGINLASGSDFDGSAGILSYLTNNTNRELRVLDTVTSSLYTNTVVESGPQVFLDTAVAMPDPTSGFPAQSMFVALLEERTIGSLTGRFLRIFFADAPGAPFRTITDQSLPLFASGPATEVSLAVDDCDAFIVLQTAGGGGDVLLTERARFDSCTSPTAFVSTPDSWAEDPAVQAFETIDFVDAAVVRGSTSVTSRVYIDVEARGPIQQDFSVDRIRVVSNGIPFTVPDSSGVKTLEAGKETLNTRVVVESTTVPLSRIVLRVQENQSCLLPSGIILPRASLFTTVFDETLSGQSSYVRTDIEKYTPQYDCFDDFRGSTILHTLVVDAILLDQFGNIEPLDTVTIPVSGAPPAGNSYSSDCTVLTSGPVHVSGGTSVSFSATPGLRTAVEEIAFPSGFNFSYQGSLPSSVFLGENGFLTFESPGGPGAFPTIVEVMPSSASPNGGIYWGRPSFWDESRVWNIEHEVVGTSPNRIFRLSIQDAVIVGSQPVADGGPAVADILFSFYETTDDIVIHFGERKLTDPSLNSLPGEDLGDGQQVNMGFESPDNTSFSLFDQSRAGTDCNSTTNTCNLSVWTDFEECVVGRR